MNVKNLDAMDNFHLKLFFKYMKNDTKNDKLYDLHLLPSALKKYNSHIGRILLMFFARFFVSLKRPT